MTYDLSAGGVRLCGQPLARIGDEVEVSLRLPETCIHTRGRVLRLGLTDGRPDFAISFADLSPDDEDAIHNLVLESLSAPGYRSVLLFQSQHDPHWPGWDWLRPLLSICTLATTPLEVVQCLHEYHIGLAILDSAGPAPRAADWNQALPELTWRTIDRAGRLHRFGRDARLEPTELVAP
jgi:hypothetical protein